MPDGTALAGKHQIRPLPFNPARLKGLSERLIVSHHENNYGGAVRNLNRTEQELAGVTKDTPPLVVAALKVSQATARAKTKFVLATDGDTFEAENLASGER